MSRVPQTVVDPGNPQSIVDHLYRIQREVDGRVAFGNPSDPNNPASTTLALGAAHNGTLLNIQGSWVELSETQITAADTAITCTHNLGVPVVGATTPNVRWLVFGWQHSGTAADAASTLSCNYEIGDTIGENAIQLRFYAAGARTFPSTLKVTLFFIPAIR